MKEFIVRFIFIALSTTILVFFSEKAYYYTQGYLLFELVLFYFFPTFVFLWVIQKFNIDHLAPLFLAAAVYGFLVEGVFTTVVYEDGLLGWFHVSYTSLAWHALLSVIFGWYFLRKLLLRGNLIPLIAWPAFFGVFWGFWSLVLWIPENPGDQISALSVSEFALYAFTFTLMLVIAHWLLGRFWMSEFKSTVTENWVVGLIILAYFAFTVVPSVGIVSLKLPILLGVTFLALWRCGKKEPSANLFEELQGSVKITRAITLFSMPAAATAVYAFAILLQPDEELIHSILYEGVLFTQTFAGWVLFLIALFLCFTRLKPLTKGSYHT